LRITRPYSLRQSAPDLWQPTATHQLLRRQDGKIRTLAFVSAIMSDWDYQNPRLAVARAMLPVMACLVAMVLPLTPIIRAPQLGDPKGYLVMCLVFAASCYWGVTARRRGSRTALRIMTVVPIVLLGLSTITALSIVLARMLGRP
jgi:hypothetical protein